MQQSRNQFPDGCADESASRERDGEEREEGETAGAEILIEADIVRGDKDRDENDDVGEQAGDQPRESSRPVSHHKRANSAAEPEPERRSGQQAENLVERRRGRADVRARLRMSQEPKGEAERKSSGDDRRQADAGQIKTLRAH